MGFYIENGTKAKITLLDNTTFTGNIYATSIYFTKGKYCGCVTLSQDAKFAKEEGEWGHVDLLTDYIKNIEILEVDPKNNKYFREITIKQPSEFVEAVKNNKVNYMLLPKRLEPKKGDTLTIIPKDKEIDVKKQRTIIHKVTKTDKGYSVLFGLI